MCQGIARGMARIGGGGTAELSPAGSAAGTGGPWFVPAASAPAPCAGAYDLPEAAAASRCVQCIAATTRALSKHQRGVARLSQRSSMGFPDFSFMPEVGYSCQNTGRIAAPRVPGTCFKQFKIVIRETRRKLHFPFCKSERQYHFSAAEKSEERQKLIDLFN